MRTTVDLPDDIYRAVKVLAAERGTTVRELVLEGLEMVRKKAHARAPGPEERRAPEEPVEGLEASDDVIGFP